MEGRKLMSFPTLEQLRMKWKDIEKSPKNNGTVEMIIARPSSGERVVLQNGTFTKVNGLMEDNWKVRAQQNNRTDETNQKMQIAIMNSRILSLLVNNKNMWKLAGDQLIVDFDLTKNNINPGDNLQIGEVVLQMTDKAHRGCGKFRNRYGIDALKFVNEHHETERRRGIYCTVIKPGTIKIGDIIYKK